MGVGDKTERASTTAAGTLALGCLAATEHDPAIRIDDPISPRLLSWRDGQFALALLRPLHPLLRSISERKVPGAYGCVVARLHHIDAIVRQEVAAGLDRLVILGAGYDTRAYRLRDRLGDVSVVEVDQPATSRDKRARLLKAFGSLPADVTFVEVDFAHEDLLERLTAHGHELSSRALFLLSGVAMFLPQTAVFELFDQVAAHSSARTSLVFDYVYEDVLTAPERYYGGREWVPYATSVGEPPRSGIRAGGVEAPLAEHGLRLDSDLTPDELTERYLRRADGTNAARPFGFSAIAHAFAAGQTNSGAC